MTFSCITITRKLQRSHLFADDPMEQCENPHIHKTSIHLLSNFHPLQASNGPPPVISGIWRLSVLANKYVNAYLRRMFRWDTGASMIKLSRYAMPHPSGVQQQYISAYNSISPGKPLCDLLWDDSTRDIRHHLLVWIWELFLCDINHVRFSTHSISISIFIFRSILYSILRNACLTLD